MTHPTRSGATMPPSLPVLALVAAPPAVSHGDPCDRVSRLLVLIRSLVLLAADGSNGPQRRAEAHRLAAQTVKQARAILDAWTDQDAYSGADGCSWAGQTLADLHDRLATAAASVRQLGALPLPQPVHTKASGIRPAPRSAGREGRQPGATAADDAPLSIISTRAHGAAR